MMSTPTVSPVHETIQRLVDVCRDGQVGFAAASKAAGDPVFRAELLQYGGQRLDFVGELNEALHATGEAAITPASAVVERVADGRPDHWSPLADALRDGASRRAILLACEAAERESIEVYRRALGAGLPTRLMAVVHTQFVALSRVRERMRSLLAAGE